MKDKKYVHNKADDIIDLSKDGKLQDVSTSVTHWILFPFHYFFLLSARLYSFLNSCNILVKLGNCSL